MRKALAVLFCLLPLASEAGYRERLERLARKDVAVILTRGFEPAPGSPMARRMKSNWPAVIQYFRSLGYMDVSLSSDLPGNAVWKGAQILARDIERSPKPVFLIAHSAGGPKSLEALRLSKEAFANTAALKFVHCPLGGAAVCEMMLNRLEPDRHLTDFYESSLDRTRAFQQMAFNFWDPFQVRRLHPLWASVEDGWYDAGRTVARGYRAVRGMQTDWIVQYQWGGDAEILNELTPSVRAKYLADHAGFLRRLGAEIPVVSVVASGGDPQKRLKQWLHERGHANDGVVEVASQSALYEMGVGKRVLVSSGHLDAIRWPAEFSQNWERPCAALLEGY